MQTKDDLIRENTELRARLELAEKWMQREVQMAMRVIQKQGVRSQARKHFANLLEEEGIDIIARRIHETFGESLKNAPEFTLERLIDAEIYWQTLQKYPTMDGLPIVLAYQKILDAWVEKVLIAPWRSHFSPEKGRLRGVTQRGIPYSVTHPNPPFSGRELESLDRDIENIITKKYTLSLGRLYQILELVRAGSVTSLGRGDVTKGQGGSVSDVSIPLGGRPEQSEVVQSWMQGGLVSGLVQFWEKNTPETFSVLISDEFFLPFSELMEREIFTKKRHEKKVTFSDAKKTREILFNGGLLHLLLR